MGNDLEKAEPLVVEGKVLPNPNTMASFYNDFFARRKVREDEKKKKGKGKGKGGVKASGTQI